MPYILGFRVSVSVLYYESRLGKDVRSRYRESDDRAREELLQGAKQLLRDTSRDSVRSACSVDRGHW